MISLRLNNDFQVRTSAQLPVDWYTDSAIYALEVKYLFSKAPQYLGHELMVPNQGDFYTLSWMQDGKALVHDQQGINLVSNVCRHRQALMLKGQGNTKHIICPLHRWTYNLKGELLGAPHFEENPCLHLDHTPLTNWQGLLFNSKRNIAEDLAAVGCKQDFNFTNYILDRVTVDEYNFNWKTFIEVYLEDYHVGPFHPGLDRFVDCDELHWEFGKDYSVQTVGYKPSYEKAGSEIYKNWQTQVKQYQEKKRPSQAWRYLDGILPIPND